MATKSGRVEFCHTDESRQDTAVVRVGRMKAFELLHGRTFSFVRFDDECDSSFMMKSRAVLHIGPIDERRTVHLFRKAEPPPVWICVSIYATRVLLDDIIVCVCFRFDV